MRTGRRLRRRELTLCVFLLFSGIPCAESLAAEPPQKSAGDSALLSRIMEQEARVTEVGEEEGVRSLLIESGRNTTILAHRLGSRLLLGDIYDENGRNVSARLARERGASTVLELFGNALRILSHKKALPEGESSVPGDVLAGIREFTTEVPLSVKGESEERLFLLTSASCPYCRKARSAIEAWARNLGRLLPFRILLLEKGKRADVKEGRSGNSSGAPAEEKDVRQKADVRAMPLEAGEAPKEAKRDTAKKKGEEKREMKGPRDAVAALLSLPTPFYIWKLSDGTLLAGTLPVEDVINRLTLMAEGRF
ncbi:MAG: hypothetical protein K5657_05620 [Desulfovibrio sp.]|nr:hypothetical protein [Desulfovibrio sp.]